MKKLSNFMWLLAIVLTATFTFVSCGDDKDNPDVEKGKVEVNPEKVFVNGMPKVMDGYVFTRDFKGRLSSMYNKKEKGLVTFDYNNNTLGMTDVPNVVMTVADSDNRTVYKLFLNKDGYVKYCDEIEYRIDNPKTTAWNFEYNSDGQLVKVVQTKDGYKRLSTIIYDGGNAVETVTKSEKDGKETDHYKIYYTSKKETLPIMNKGCLIFNKEQESGYVVAVVDNAGRGTEAQYWINDFLHVRKRKDEYANTQNFMSFTKKFITEKLPKDIEISKADQIELLNKSIQFFKVNDLFNIQLTANNYLTFVLHTSLPLAVIFELPVAVAFLTSLHILTPQYLIKNRRYGYFILLVVAVVLTPADFISDLTMAAPLILLYEVSISVCKYVYKRRRDD